MICPAYGAQLQIVKDLLFNLGLLGGPERSKEYYISVHVFRCKVHRPRVICAHMCMYYAIWTFDTLAATLVQWSTCNLRGQALMKLKSSRYPIGSAWTNWWSCVPL